MARTATTKKIFLSLYYLVAILVPITALVYFNANHFSQSSMQSGSTTTTKGIDPVIDAMYSPSSQAEAMGLHDIGGTLWYEGSCSYRSADVRLPIDPSSLQIFNAHYFGDATTMWIEYGNGCDAPVQITLNPPIDRASFATVGDTWLASDAHGLIAMVWSGENNSTGFPLYTAKRIPEITDPHFRYIESNEGSSDAFIENNDSVYYYQYGTSTLQLVPGLPTGISKVYYVRNGFYVITDTAVYDYSTWNRNSPALIQLSQDPKTFHKIISDYWGDSVSVIFGTTTLQGASSSDFKPLYSVGSLNDYGDGYYSSNGNVYLDTRIVAKTPFYELPGQPTFDTGACGQPSYWTDGRTVFYAGVDLHANPNTLKFSFFPGLKCEAAGYAWDGQKSFYRGEQILGVDAGTFKVIKNEYARDAYHVYDEGKLMTGDPDQLEKDILSGKIVHVYDDTGY